MKPFEWIGKRNATILYETGTAAAAGIRRIASVVCDDARLVTGQAPGMKELPELSMEIKRVFGEASRDEEALREAASRYLCDIAVQAEGDVVISGVLTGSGIADVLAAAGLLDVSEIAGKRECFTWQVLTLDADCRLHTQREWCQKAPKRSEARKHIWLIAGSDRLGAIYGLLEISRRSGVSPWCYWGDVMPKKQEELTWEVASLAYTSKEPSVRLRGFFMNDEWPSLGNWVSNTFGDFNSDFYEQVFVLLLRMRGNFLWPAMWSASFPIDGGKGDPAGNMRLADELGIVMGTSHHEPMIRASEEWDKVKSTNNAEGYGKDWNYFTNPQGLHRYWEDSIAERWQYRSLITLGMRGERDTKVMGEDATLADNIELLKDVIRDQKDILKKHGLQDAPTVLALYKEVEDYYYGDASTPGLATWEELDDVCLLLSDDNFGNVRTLPTPETANRKAGWGLYYHFDYHGAPISYEWVNSTPIIKVWEQMTQAYEYGVRELWVVNVGDVRPQELPLSFFLDMAYDFEQWGTGATPEKILTYERLWANKQFGAWADEETLQELAGVLRAYTRMNGARRPETVYEDTFSTTQEQEAQRELLQAQEIIARCDALAKKVPAEHFAAFYGLVYFPAVASANVREMMIAAGFYQTLVEQKGDLEQILAYHEQVQRCIALDQELTRRYHQEMADGKWNGMMSSAHVGFHNWNDEGWSYPQTKALSVEEWEALCGKESSKTEPVGDIVVLEAGDFAEKQDTHELHWLLIPEYGKTEGSLKMMPVTVSARNISESPYVTYRFAIETAGTYQVTVYVSPTNPLERGMGQRFGLQLDGGVPEVLDSLPSNFAAGDYYDYNWCQGVLKNVRKVRWTVSLSAGSHELVYYGVDAGVLLQKIEVAQQDAGTYYGYAKSLHNLL